MFLRVFLSESGSHVLWCPTPALMLRLWILTSLISQCHVGLMLNLLFVGLHHLLLLSLRLVSTVHFIFHLLSALSLEVRLWSNVLLLHFFECCRVRFRFFQWIELLLCLIIWFSSKSHFLCGEGYHLHWGCRLFLLIIPLHQFSWLRLNFLFLL